MILFSRIPLMSYGAEAETFLITSTTVAGTILPANIRPLENFGKLFFCKFYLQLMWSSITTRFSEVKACSYS